MRAFATDQHKKVERAHAQLDQIESLVPVLQLRTLELEAWAEFLERGRRLDA